jgi:hypothetical protein
MLVPKWRPLDVAVMAAGTLARGPAVNSRVTFEGSGITARVFAAVIDARKSVGAGGGSAAVKVTATTTTYGDTKCR